MVMIILHRLGMFELERDIQSAIGPTKLGPFTSRVARISSVFSCGISMYCNTRPTRILESTPTKQRSERRRGNLIGGMCSCALSRVKLTAIDRCCNPHAFCRRRLLQKLSALNVVTDWMSTVLMSILLSNTPLRNDSGQATMRSAGIAHVSHTCASRNVFPDPAAFMVNV